MQITLSEDIILNRMLAVHHLSHRCGSSDTLQLFDSVGFHTPTEEALGIALSARSESLSKECVDDLFENGSLLCTMSLRSASRTIRSDQWGVFNRSLAPVVQEELLTMISGAKPLLAPLGMSPMQLLDLTVTLLREQLRDNALTKSQLCRVLAREASLALPFTVREVWNWPSVLFEGQTLGESLMRYLLPVAALSIPLRLDRNPKNAGFLYTLVGYEHEEEAPSLVHRYLHAFGPADTETFARWAGISSDHALRLWRQLNAEELVQVTFSGRSGWLLSSDVESFSSAKEFEGIRFLSPFDPLRKLPVRTLLVHGKTQHLYFFRSSTSPGMVLSDGQCVAGWRMRKKRKSWSLVVEDIGEPLGRIATDELEQEAQKVSKAIGMMCDGISIART